MTHDEKMKEVESLAEQVQDISRDWHAWSNDDFAAMLEQLSKDASELASRVAEESELS